jgi:hypothetical protein
VLVYALVDSRPSPLWGDALDLYLTRDAAVADLEGIRSDEPERERFLRGEPVELVAADYPN